MLVTLGFSFYWTIFFPEISGYVQQYQDGQQKMRNEVEGELGSAVDMSGLCFRQQTHSNQQ